MRREEGRAASGGGPGHQPWTLVDGLVTEKGRLKGQRAAGALGSRGCWGSWEPRENSDAKRKAEP